MSQYSFFFDSSSCSGCKACQAACKDKHGLEVGRLWRRVYEVSGGGWRQEGTAWVSDAYAYNLSISCNHCQQPTCVEACPTTALYRRPDGLVLIDPQRCIGCRYCTWACPYGAPQYDPQTRVMTKCTGCVDYLEAGLPPACVSACPLRVLDFGDQETLQTRYAASGNGLVQAVAPLPEKELTQPGLLIRPHRDTQRAAQGTPRLANLEEVHTAPSQDERPLVLFTVLAQMAVGAFLALGLLDIQQWVAVAEQPVFVVCVMMLAALLLSLLHLGNPLKAYQAIANWRTSWLSREILSAGAFTTGLVLYNFMQWFYPFRPGYLKLEGRSFWFGQFPAHSIIFFLTALAGLALVYSISRVYRLRTTPVWNNGRATTAFFATAFLLGPLFASLLVFLDRKPAIDFGFVLGYDQTLLKLTLLSAWIALAMTGLQAWLELTSAVQPASKYLLTRLWLLLGSALAILILLMQLYQGGSASNWTIAGFAIILSFIFALASELLGRWLFYKKKSHTGL